MQRHNNISRKKQVVAKRTAVECQAHANCMDQQLTVHWHSCWTMLCDLHEATLTNTKRKITIDWCPDHVVCRTRSAHAVTPSGMLFSEQKSQEFCGPYLDIGPPTSFQAAALASGRRTRLRPPPPQAPPSNTETCAGASDTLPLRLCVGR
jgi:hypothetical protein